MVVGDIPSLEAVFKVWRTGERLVEEAQSAPSLWQAGGLNAPTHVREDPSSRRKEEANGC